MKKKLEFKYQLLQKVCLLLKPEIPLIVVAYQIQADWSILYGVSNGEAEWKFIAEYELNPYLDSESRPITILF